MSQNRTVYPGVEPERRESRGGRSGYAGASRSEYRGTFFPDKENSRNVAADRASKEGSGRQYSKPVVGFLFSLSRTGFGEYWPIHIGANTIGRSPQCDVFLPEGTVSEEHATIVVRMMKNPRKLDASISDEKSSHGTMLNGESISATHPLECRNGDMITVGECYQLYLILIDAEELGLKVSEKFIDISSDEEEFDYGAGPSMQGRTRDVEDFPPRFNGGQPRQAQENDGTVGIDGNAGRGPYRGGTKAMDETSDLYR